MRSGSRIFDNVTGAITGAAGLANGVRREIEQIVRGRVQSLLANMDLVQREEYEALEAQYVDLCQRVAKLETKLEATQSDAASAKAKPRQTAKKSTKSSRKPAQTKSRRKPNAAA